MYRRWRIRASAEMRTGMMVIRSVIVGYRSDTFNLMRDFELGWKVWGRVGREQLAS